jgi:triacylglycerol lipase
VRRQGGIALALVCALAVPGPASAEPAGPALTVPQDRLDAALDCDPFTHPDAEPVLLVHGTFTYGEEQWDWTFRPLLAARGFDVCVVSYPDRGLGDIQESSEYVVNAVRRMSAATGRKVGIVGHSQGGIEPRWAMKWWPDVRSEVADYVGLASPNHGTDPAAPPGVPMPASLWQMTTGSRFLGALNAGDETPGEASYTDVYSDFDELVQPARPVPTAALDWGRPSAAVANIDVQDVCPGRLTEHLTIGTIDRLAFALTVDALSHAGPASAVRAGACGPVSLLPDLVLDPALVGDLLGVLPTEPAHFPPDPHLVTTEPPLRPYATAPDPA